MFSKKVRIPQKDMFKETKILFEKIKKDIYAKHKIVYSSKTTKFNKF